VSFASVCASLVALCGCGGSSPTKTTPTTTQSARPTAPLSNADIGSAPAQISSHEPQHRSQGARGDNASRPSAPVGATHGPGAGKAEKARPSQTTEVSEGVAKPVNPCKLVSTSEARAITGQLIAARIEAPLGPTCIYRFAGSQSQITLSIESASLSQIAHQMTKRTRVTVGGRQAYCGSLGTKMLFVPLPGGRVLHVTAPCAIAQHFAAVALGRAAI
jgi:hypothetical protein